MALQLGALRDALLSANADPIKANAAAEEVAKYDAEFATIRTDLAGLKGMVGAVIALLLIVIGKLFVFHG